jgi:hypothetical protein
MTDGSVLSSIPPEVLSVVADLTEEVVAAAAELGGSLVLDPATTLGLRAELLGFGTPGAVSANGQSHLIRCSDGWIALTLVRPEDIASMPALIGGAVGPDPWAAVEKAVAGRSVEDVVTLGRLLGIPIAPLPVATPAATPRIVTEALWSHGARRSQIAGLRVADLSALWAGPLTAKILGDAGALVTKIESVRRPDGARSAPSFYDLLHDRDQHCLVIDLDCAGDRAALRDELWAADVVIEASRPRALEQLGVGPEQMDDWPGQAWLSITGYGRDEPGRHWVAFGDDAAAAGGLVAYSPDGCPHFIGDAAADPISGLFGALGILQAIADGGGRLVDVALQRSAAWVAAQR